MASEAVGVSESATRGARELRIVLSRLRRRLKETSDPRELTASQTSVLSRLSKDGAATASDLAAAERVRPQSMATILTALDKRGLIARRPDPGDGRRQLLSLSDAGHELVEDKRRAGEEWLACALQECFTESERRTLIEALALLERLTSP
jgi:DNA-binding MarR family transcriptional regulator